MCGFSNFKNVVWGEGAHGIFLSFFLFNGQSNGQISSGQRAK